MVSRKFMVSVDLVNILFLKLHYCILLFYPLHDDVIKWKHFPRYWPFVRGIHRWLGALMFSLIWASMSKQSWGCWFETPSHPLWRHSDVSACTTLSGSKLWVMSKCFSVNISRRLTGRWVSVRDEIMIFGPDNASLTRRQARSLKLRGCSSTNAM